MVSAEHATPMPHMHGNVWLVALTCDGCDTAAQTQRYGTASVTEAMHLAILVMGYLTIRKADGVQAHYCRECRRLLPQNTRRWP